MSHVLRTGAKVVPFSKTPRWIRAFSKDAKQGAEKTASASNRIFEMGMKAAACGCVWYAGFKTGEHAGFWKGFRRGKVEAGTLVGQPVPGAGKMYSSQEAQEVVRRLASCGLI